jgi:hypothetical protein
VTDTMDGPTEIPDWPTPLGAEVSRASSSSEYRRTESGGTFVAPSPPKRLDRVQKMALAVCLFGLLLSEVFAFIAGAYFGAGHARTLLGHKPVTARTRQSDRSCH